MKKRLFAIVVSVALLLASLPIGGLVMAETALLKSGDGQRPGGTTNAPGQPFAGIPDAALVRIPGLLSLQDGRIAIVQDMRYHGWPEGGGIDTVMLLSDDMGKTWDYSFPIYFADSTDSGYPCAATAIDPYLMQAADGTIYIMANAAPSGISNIIEEGFIDFELGRGTVEIDGALRLVLSESWDGAFTNPATDDGTVYPFYVGDIAANGYAPILRRADGSATRWAVDDALNIYEIVDGAYVELTQEQYTANEKNGTLVQQNLFFRDSVLHVYNTAYLWCATSKDGGETWSHSIIDNMKGDNEYGSRHGCGHGIVTASGRMVMNMYFSAPNTYDSGLAFSDDNGKTWTRSANLVPHQHGNYCSNEGAIVELADGTLRLFFRSDGSPNKVLQYCDAKWDEEQQNYVFGDVVLTDITANNSTEIGAITYSKTIDGAQAVMVSAPADPGMRADGKIWTFLIRENNEMELAYVWDFPHYWEPQSFGYSDLDELKDGSIGIFCENVNRYENPSIKEVCPGAVIGDEAVSYPPYADTASGATLGKNSVVTLRTEENSTVYYTLDGSDPTTASAVYADGLTFINSSAETQEVTLKVMAVTQGKAPSRVLTYNYTVSSADSVVADFEDLAFSIVNDGSTSSVVDGALQYKVYSGWGLKLSFDGDATFVPGTDSALAFHISVPADAPANHSIVFFAKESTGAGYGLYPGQTVYLVGDNATEVATATVNAATNNHWTAQSVNIAPGFSGYVVIPTASMYNGDQVRTSPYAGSTVDENGQLDLNAITGVVFSNGGGGAFNEVVNTVDNITLVYDRAAFITQNLDKKLTCAPSIESGASVLSGTAVTLQTNDTKTVVYYTLDGSDPTRESKVYNGKVILTADETAEVTLKVLVTLEGNGDSEIFTYTYTVTNGNQVLADFENAADYSVSAGGGSVTVADGVLSYYTNSGWPVSVGVTPLSDFVADENGGIAFHIDVPDTLESNYLVFCAKESGGAGYLLAGNRTVYTITDGGVADTVTTNASTNNWYERYISLPGGFRGWVVIPSAVLENADSTWGSATDANGQLDLNDIVMLGFGHANGSQNTVTNVVDDVTLLADAAAFANECEANALSLDTNAPDGSALVAGTTVTYKAESGTIIYYTTDGSEPTRADAVYADGITLSADAITSVTIKLLVTKDGRKDMVYTYGYTIVPKSVVVADFENASEYTVTIPSGEGAVADGVFAFKSNSGWSVSLSVKTAVGYMTGDDSAFAFHISVPNTKPDNYIVLAARETNGSTYTLAANKPVYLVADGATEATRISTYTGAGAAWYNRNIVLPGGFSGWVVVPTASLYTTTDTDWGGIKDADGKLDLDLISTIGFGHGSGSQNDIVYTVDNVMVAYDAQAFVQDHLAKTLAVAPSIESGSTVVNGTVLTLTANEADATIRYTIDGSDPTDGVEYEDSITLKNTTGTPITVEVKVLVTLDGAADLTATYIYTVTPSAWVVEDFEDPSSVSIKSSAGEATVADGVLTYKETLAWGTTLSVDTAPDFVTGENGAIALHVSTDAEYWWTFAAIETGGASYMFNGGTIKLVADDGTVTEVATSAGAGAWYQRCVGIPAGFSGYVVIPTTALVATASTWGSGSDANGQLDLSDIAKLGFSNNAGACNSRYLTLDNITLVADVDDFVDGLQTVENDLNGDRAVNSRDAIYLLYHTLLPEQYPVSGDCDYTGDGVVDSEDAIYLLYYTMLPELYPID
ncbi:MAG: chitobiase/beta-hexosaminidase C-terminal domain-containing protein [Clostridia bacterium]|nr:chitobiase/beta-hexosaminidase C-terminal domain-containing protein [Clostridia bacterium]